MKKIKLFLAIVFLTICNQTVRSQEFFTIMSYNVLNFPNGQPLNRQDTLKKIVNHVQPDILLLQELKSEAGLNAIAEESCADLNGDYISAEWVSQQSNPNSSWPLQQNAVYNSSKFTLHSQSEVLTDYRDFNEFVFYFNSEELLQNSDTAFLYVFVTHLKSSQGIDNEEIRLEMVQSFTDYLETIPESAQVILAGDFNLYYSEEPAYQALLSTENAVVLEDPIDMPGEWTESSYQHKEIFTQSTRPSQIFSDGAGGGVDDRFDFMLCSSNMLDGSVGYQYLENSYYALGNNGDCYNESIIQCSATNFNVPESVMISLYYMSDHLPVIMQLSLDQTLGVELLEHQPRLLSTVVESYLEFGQKEYGIVSVYDLSGKLALQREINGSVLDVNDLKAGVYMIKLAQGKSCRFTKL